VGLAKYQLFLFLFLFLFHYSGLAAVSPPTALAPFAAAARTRDDAFATMLQAWKYCLRQISFGRYSPPQPVLLRYLWPLAAGSSGLRA
jgi:hypothetical protein